MYPSAYFFFSDEKKQKVLDAGTGAGLKCKQRPGMKRTVGDGGKRRGMLFTRLFHALFVKHKYFFDLDPNTLKSQSQDFAYESHTHGPLQDLNLVS